MQIRYGFDVALQLAQPTTIITMMDVHSDVRCGVGEESELEVTPAIPTERFVDENGNIVRRLWAPAGVIGFRLDGVFRSDGRSDAVDPAAGAAPVSGLPPETLPFLRPSRYCETDLLSDFAWASFGSVNGGWAKVQAICDFVHQRLRFSYPRPGDENRRRSISRGVGVCRDLIISPLRCAAVSTFRPAIATAISAISASRRIPL